MNKKQFILAALALLMSMAGVINNTFLQELIS